MRLFVTGGAGYIGSHVVLAALDKGYEVTVFDNLSTGLKQNLNKNARFVFGATTSESDLTKVLKNNQYDAVIHLAASKAAGDSMINPLEYSYNNIAGGLNLIRACLNHNVKIFVYSSTAAVYGMPKYSPIDELHPLKPESYYGYTKLVIEDNLKWFSELKGLRYASLRYFNAAGYDVNKRISGLEVNPQNLIPKVMETAIGIRSYINIYGDDYNTADGTGVRDYVHVNDLAIAHIDAIEYLFEKEKNLSINLGTGIGYSVYDIINKTKQISNKRIKSKVANRRPGDSSEVIADPLTAKKIINWEAKFSDLDTIIDSTWHAYMENLENIKK